MRHFVYPVSLRGGDGDYLNAHFNREYEAFYRKNCLRFCGASPCLKILSERTCSNFPNLLGRGYANRYRCHSIRRDGWRAARSPLTEPNCTAKGPPWAAVQSSCRGEHRASPLWLRGASGSPPCREKAGSKCCRMIPGLENADFFVYGVMHHNTLSSIRPMFLIAHFAFRGHRCVSRWAFTGTEGYAEAVASAFSRLSMHADDLPRAAARGASSYRALSVPCAPTRQQTGSPGV